MTQKTPRRHKERLLYEICEFLTKPSFIGGWYLGMYKRKDKTLQVMSMSVAPEDAYTEMLLYAASVEPVYKASILEAAETIKKEEAAQ